MLDETLNLRAVQQGEGRPGQSAQETVPDFRVTGQAPPLPTDAPRADAWQTVPFCRGALVLEGSTQKLTSPGSARTCLRGADTRRWQGGHFNLVSSPLPPPSPVPPWSPETGVPALSPHSPRDPPYGAAEPLLTRWGSGDGEAEGQCSVPPRVTTGTVTLTMCRSPHDVLNRVMLPQTLEDVTGAPYGATRAGQRVNTSLWLVVTRSLL